MYLVLENVVCSCRRLAGSARTAGSLARRQRATLYKDNLMRCISCRIYDEARVSRHICLRQNTGCDQDPAHARGLHRGADIILAAPADSLRKLNVTLGSHHVWAHNRWVIHRWAFLISRRRVLTFLLFFFHFVLQKTGWSWTECSFMRPNQECAHFVGLIPLAKHLNGWIIKERHLLLTIDVLHTVLF